MARDERKGLAALLRARRLKARLAVPQLAGRLGVSPETVWAIERGRSPLRSTAMAYLAVLPVLACELLPGGSPCPVATHADWEWLALRQGMFAKTCSLTLNAAGGARHAVLRVSMARPLSLKGASALRLVARAISRIGPLGESIDFDALRPNADDALLVTANGEEHRWWLGSDGNSVDYEHVQVPTDGEGPELRLHHCVERLVIRWDKAAGAPAHVRPVVSPDSIALERAEPHLVRLLHPDAAPAMATTRGYTWTLSRPLPGFRYGLRSTDTAESWSRAPGDAIAGARKAARLSLRDLATRSGVSHAAITYVEQGRDARLDTLARLLASLPALSPQALLPERASPGVADARRAWTLYRDAFGYQVARLKKTVVVADDGSSEVMIASMGLRPTRGDIRDLHVRTGLQRAVAQTSESVLLEVESDVENLKLRLVRRTVGPVEHEFRLPVRPGRSPLSYVRRYRGPRFTLRAADWGGPTTSELEAGVALPVFHPVQLALLEIRLPSAALPRWARGHVRPSFIPPGQHGAVLAAPWVELKVQRRHDGTRVVLRCAKEQPLVGEQLALSWGLPD